MVESRYKIVRKSQKTLAGEAAVTKENKITVPAFCSFVGVWIQAKA
jgi:hypothetical protein